MRRGSARSEVDTMQVNHHISAIEAELTPFFRSPAALEPDSANPSTIPLHIIACNRSRSHVLFSESSLQTILHQGGQLPVLVCRLPRCSTPAQL